MTIEPKSRDVEPTPKRFAARPGSKLLLALAAVALTVLGIEAAGRLARFDFEFKTAAFNRLPIFWRQPVVPIGPGFFRRPGPDRWTGRALDEEMKMVDCNNPIYRDDPVLTIEYDRFGFRNPPDLTDWRVVIAGDSFTELGYLPYEDLFSTRLARRLKAGVKNLGASFSGTFTETAYLSAFGRGPSTTDAIVVFYEGNDPGDIADEHGRMQAFAADPAHAPVVNSKLEQLTPQTSFLTAAYRLATAREKPRQRLLPEDCVNAMFVRGRRRTPLTVLEPLAQSSAFSPQLKDVIDEAIRGWGQTARRLGLRPWLAFMPCKRRVLDGYMRSVPGDEPIPATPSDLPSWIAEVSARNGVQFIDLTPALRREAEAGRIPYNTVWDTHLNRLGSHVVAKALGDALVAAGVNPAHGG